MKQRWIWIMLAGLALAGCQEYQLQHTLFLEPGGRVSWQIGVREFLSNEEPSAQDRQTEEKRLEELLEGMHPFEEILLEAGALNTGIVLIRDRAPFEYVVRAEFAGIDPVLAILFEDWSDLNWETQWSENGYTLHIWTDQPASTLPPEDFPMVEMIIVDGQLESEQPANRIRLSRPQDWQNLIIKGPYP